MAINITDISVIHNMKNTMEQCSTESLKQINPIWEYIGAKKNTIERNKLTIINRINDAERKLQNSNNMLTLCRSGREYDVKGNVEPNNCNSEKRATRRAMHDLKAARRNLSEIEELIDIVNIQLQKYKEITIKFKYLNTNFKSQSIDFLNQVIELFEQYIKTGKSYGSF